MDAGSISALAAVVGACVSSFLAYRATHEMQRWRIQQRETKRAAIAGDVLVAALHFAGAVEFATSLTIIGRMMGPELRTAIMRRAEAIDSGMGPYFAAWKLAEAYLTEEIAQSLELLYREARAVLACQLNLAEFPDGDLGADEAIRQIVLELQQGGFGNGPRGRIAALVDQVRAPLRRIAQHTDSTAPSSWTEPMPLPPGE